MFKIKRKLFIAVMVLGITAFVSCEKESIESDLPSPDEFEYIGQEHNRGLEYVYENLSIVLNRNQEMLQKDDLFSVVNKYTNEFYLKSEITREYYDEAKVYSEKQLFSTRNYYAKKNKGDEDSFLDSCIINGNFSDVQKTLLTELMNRVDTVDNLSDVQAVIEEINLEATELINDSVDLAVIFITTSVMESSCEYWYEHFDEWNDLFSDDAKAQEDWWSWNSVGKADAVGAAGGAAAGAIAGAFAGGVGALPGAGIGALSCGIGGSVGDAVSQLWDHWFREK